MLYAVLKKYLLLGNSLWTTRPAQTLLKEGRQLEILAAEAVSTRCALHFLQIQDCDSWSPIAVSWLLVGKRLRCLTGAAVTFSHSCVCDLCEKQVLVH